MAEYNPNERRGRRDRNNPSPRPPVVSAGRATRRRTSNNTVTIAALALLVVVLGVIGFFGWKMLSQPKGAPANAQAPATSGATAGANTASGATAKATSTSKPVVSPDASAAAGAGSSSAAAWRDADPVWMDKYKGKLIDGFKTEPGYKAVALTFDDGPNGETQYVIATLAKYGGQATFFDSGRKLAMGWAKSQPKIIADAGFELANHTQHHTLPDGISSMWHRTRAIDLAEINGPDEIIKSYGGTPTVWLRPMGGMIDATGIKAAVDTNHLVINWTIDSNDSHGGPRTPDYIYSQVTSNIKSGDVVLLHVTHPESMKALPRIAATLSERGFKLVTVSELAQHSTGAIPQRIPN